jgi:hypothetical protein
MSLALTESMLASIGTPASQALLAMAPARRDAAMARRAPRDVRACAVGTMLALPEQAMLRAALAQVAALPRRPLAAWFLSQLDERAARAGG